MIHCFTLKNWVDKFQTAKAAVASVGVAAAAAAQASLQEAYDKCSRISLALTLRVSFMTLSYLEFEILYFSYLEPNKVA